MLVKPVETLKIEVYPPSPQNREELLLHTAEDFCEIDLEHFDPDHKAFRKVALSYACA